MIRKAFLHANVIDVLNDKILPDTTTVSYTHLTLPTTELV